MNSNSPSCFIAVKINQLARVVQTLDSAIQRINHGETNCAIQWIEIYPADSVIHLLNNWGLMFVVCSYRDSN